MFFEFPSLTNLYDYEFQVMIGDSLLFIPVVNEYATYVSGYLPESEIWYDIFTGKKV